MLESNDNIHPLELLFNPKNVVILRVGGAIEPMVKGFKRQGFDLDNLYLISPREESFLGLRCYKSLEEIPIDHIDLLILSIRRDLLVETLQEVLSKKKVNFIHIFTAGTGEFDQTGSEIEQELKRILDNYKNTRSIGPNCMGIYSPRGNAAYYSSFPEELGNIGLIFQSGDLHSKIIKFGSRRYHLRFSIGVSIGNCVDIQISEVLHYLNEDKDTDVICVYFEGISPIHKNEGKRLLEVLKNMKKPVLFMRGGKTERGQTAVLSHTGSMATNKNIWKAVYRQTSLIEIPSSLDELIDIVYLFSSYFNRFKKLKKEVEFPRNKRTLIILWSGGFGILATDTMIEMGLEVPQFKGETLEKLTNIYPIRVGSLANPLDLPFVTYQKELVDVTKAAVDEDISLVIIETDAWKNIEGKRFKGYYENLLEIRDYVENQNKTVIIILHQYPSESRKVFVDMLLKDNFLVYPSLEAAAKSYLKLYEYGKKIEGFKKK
ncbi:MAG: CoA-binding protein [Candidatus Lokiarchaeota archaeon]|nr:CoA-binding protein [Candidatus Lokiarchaeota archaeon]